jgi:TPP-dependent 2-oxoacid decarboxylase
VICNNGYTIERYIHGWKESYNDIQQWKFVDVPSTFGGEKSQFKTHQVKTRDELKGLFKNEEFSSAPCLQVSGISQIRPVESVRADLFSSWNCICRKKMLPQL